MAGGYVWHSTGRGKTLTSFKTAQLATQLDYIDRVLFVVDRQDLDNQTQREYNRFQKDCVKGTVDTAALTARKRGNGRIPGNIPRNAGNDGPYACITRPFILRAIAHDSMAYGRSVIERIALPEQAHTYTIGANDTTLIGTERTGKQREQCRFPVTVAPHDTDAIARIDAERHTVEHYFRGKLDPNFFTTK